jgi:hypothetical protein
MMHSAVNAGANTKSGLYLSEITAKVRITSRGQEGSVCGGEAWRQWGGGGDARRLGGGGERAGGGGRGQHGGGGERAAGGGRGKGRGGDRGVGGGAGRGRGGAGGAHNTLGTHNTLTPTTQYTHRCSRT